MRVCVTLSHHVEGACEIDTGHTSEGQRQVTPQQTTAHVLIWHVGSNDNCYATVYDSAKFRPSVWTK